MTLIYVLLAPAALALGAAVLIAVCIIGARFLRAAGRMMHDDECYYCHDEDRP